MTVKLQNPAGLYDSSPNAYSQVATVPAGQRLAFISGQGGDNPDGSFSPDFAAQAASAFRNVGLALAALGAGPENVAKITVLIVDHDMEKLRIMQAAQRVLFGAHHPAATLIPVPCLALPQMLIEVEAIAALPA
ncbi:MAG: RidA family protein [Proteobacteria bacterium]|jgi:enamine deaminase RidA (YjgF/YER057c/UK114 family)|nr:RidA family protein [Pseudomonadota bacterium]MBK9251441.1 RidA family protein [Pseudomonadota bacterium]